MNEARAGRRAGEPDLTSLEMRSERSAIPATVERVLSAVRAVGLPSDRLHDLAIAVSEALSNAAIHGNHLDPQKTVAVSIRVRPGDHAVIQVKDQGKGFDMRRVSDPTDPAKVLATGGRGVFLMRKLVDRVEYRDSGSLVRLTVGRTRSR